MVTAAHHKELREQGSFIRSKVIDKIKHAYRLEEVDMYKHKWIVYSGCYECGGYQYNPQTNKWDYVEPGICLKRDAERIRGVLYPVLGLSD